MQKLVGDFYKNGKKIGPVEEAEQADHFDFRQMGQLASLERIPQYRLKLNGRLSLGLDESQNTYEIDSEIDSQPARIRVYPQTAEDRGNSYTSVVVRLSP